MAARTKPDDRDMRELQPNRLLPGDASCSCCDSVSALGLHPTALSAYQKTC